MPVTKQCEHCRQGYLIPASKVRRSRYCGTTCYNAGRRRQKTQTKSKRTEKGDVKSRHKPLIKTCNNCLKEFTVKHCLAEEAKFCSIGCRRSFGRIQKTCETCGAYYYCVRSQAHTSRFCSRGCYEIWWGKYQREKAIRLTYCKVCNQEMERYQGTLNAGRGVTCSEKCRRQLYSELFRGEGSGKWVSKIKVICVQCGVSKQVRPSKEKGFRFCSKKCKGAWMSQNVSGPNSPLWKGEISDSVLARKRLMSSSAYKEWRGIVYKRDKYTCRHCGKKGRGDLHAHHIQPVATHPESVFSVENGLTLCINCHTKLHQQMPHLAGKSRLKEYLQSIERAAQRSG